jgi:hypothetical protein
MYTTGQIINAVILLGLVPAHWFLPRKFGMLAAHFLTVFTWIAMTAIAINSGSLPYEGIEQVIGLAIQAFLFNCLMLPIACFAMWRYVKTVDPWWEKPNLQDK